MKKNNYLYFIIILLFCMLLSGCKKHKCDSSDWIYPDDVICGTYATIEKHCIKCGKVLETKSEIISNAHDFKIETIEATCTEDGQRLISCTKCSYELVEVIEAKHDLIENRVEATCTEDGYIELTCSKCDYYSEEIIKALGHDLIITDVEPKCQKKGYHQEECKNCDYFIKNTLDALKHDLVISHKEPTCSENGYDTETCKRCDYEYTNILLKTGHKNIDYVILREATDDLYGIKCKECKDCFERIEVVNYQNNGFSKHGKLSVSGKDLVDKNGDKVQLLGLSTHGLQWASRYVNYDTFAALRDSFGINVIRLALYTAEEGYVESYSESRREWLYNLVVNGINYATELDMYVIIDWHMLGPNLYEDEAITFFTKIAKQFSDHDNILFEIMNEPYSNETKKITWSDCKAYAQKIIPAIRQYSDGIVLVGSPHYSTDLDVIAKDPLENVENIMYTYHFYAASHTDNGDVLKAYVNDNLPVFISEHGGMNADGNDKIDYVSYMRWYNMLNQYNISYVAWNVSNTRGDASILKYGNSTLTSFTQETMKTWGYYYRCRVRERLGLPYVDTYE